ncbi:MAG: hydrogenase maturation protease [Desulfurococcales archaeon]|nr:hydrogenase maturation protease [Desulfurococcales archaeon]
MDALRDIVESVKPYLCSEEGAIACVGTELRRDDVAGLEVCRNLESVEGLKGKLILCPYGLENCLEDIIRRGVKKLLVIDAALPIGGEGGEYIITALDNVSSNYLATTHNIPVPMIVRYLRLRGVARDVTLLGIVARDLRFGEGVTEEVRKTIDEVVEGIKEAYMECTQ